MKLNLIEILADAVLLGNRSPERMDRETAFIAVMTFLSDLEISTDPTPSSLETLIASVAQKHGFSAEQLKGPRRPQELVDARWEFIREARAKGHSMPQIGRAINRDHTTVKHALDSMQ